MVQRTFRAVLSLVCMAALCGSLHAQAPKTITVRVLDAKTGQPVADSNLLVRINELDAMHNDWVRQNDDGTASVKIPAGASVLSVQATYDNSMEIYINCDAGKQKNTSTMHWYSVTEILTSGVVAPNECGKEKDVDKIRATAKPGEFVFFVRKRNWREQD